VVCYQMSLLEKISEIDSNGSMHMHRHVRVSVFLSGVSASCADIEYKCWQSETVDRDSFLTKPQYCKCCIY